MDDKSLTHRLYRDLVSGSLAFGAERMVGTLQRMCERLAYLADENTPTRDLAGGTLYHLYLYGLMLLLQSIPSGLMMLSTVQ